MTRVHDGAGPFPDDPADTRTAIMKATFEALCEHGYADLTIQRIGEQFPKSKSLLYHHYEGKDELLLEFLSYMLERFEEHEVRPTTGDDPETQLRSFLDHTVPAGVEERNTDFVRAIVELRAQAAHDPAYREQFTRTRAHFRSRVAEIVAEGVATGAFRDVDPDRVADLVVTVVSGAMVDGVTTTADLADARAELDGYIDACVLAPDA